MGSAAVPMPRPIKRAHVSPLRSRRRLVWAGLAKSDARAGPNHVDAAEDRIHATLVGGEDVLDETGPACAGRVGADDACRHGRAARLGAPELGPKAAPAKPSEVRLAGGSGIGPAGAEGALVGSGIAAGRLPSRQAAGATVERRMKPCSRSMPGRVS